MASFRFPLALLVASTIAPSVAFAHAQLQQATPAVGGTVTSSPKELRLRYSEGVEPRFSSVTLTDGGGTAVPLGRPSTDPQDQTVLVVKLGHALAAGTYAVTWHVVSVDTHKTQGSFDFTVSP
jgi:methionine-rich copper-binding protein CopC